MRTRWNENSEPEIAEILNEPTVKATMLADGVTYSQLHELIRLAREALRSDGDRFMPEKTRKGTERPVATAREIGEKPS